MPLHSSVADDILRHCDRTRSAEARLALDLLLVRPLRAHGLNLSSSCLLSPARDVLSAQEATKRQVTPSLWSCTLCNKLFRSEHFLDKHLARHHPLLRHPETTVCHAELCDTVIPCIPLTNPPLPPVSTVILSQNLNPSLSPTPHCPHGTAHTRRLAACQNIVDRCVHTATGPPALISRDWHIARLRHELCARAVLVSCVPRPRVWDRIGRPHVILRTSARFPTAYFFLSALFIFVIVGVLAVFGVSKRTSARRSARERRHGHQHWRRQRVHLHRLDRRKDHHS